MTGGRQAICVQSPTGEHETVTGSVTEYCKHCGLIKRYVSVGKSGRLVESSEVNPDWAQSKPKKKRVVDPIKTEIVGAMAGAKKRPKVIALIERDGARCFYCEHKLLDPREHWLPDDQWWPTVDHLLPQVHGGHSELDNLVLACRACNHRKGEHLYLLVEVIRRTRKQRDEAVEYRRRDQEYIERLKEQIQAKSLRRLDVIEGSGQDDSNDERGAGMG